MSSESPNPENPPTSSAERLRHELDRWLDAAWSQGEKALDVMGLRPGARNWVPSVDVTETPEHVVVAVDLPGVDPQSVDVSLAGNMLSIRGTWPEHNPAELENAHTRERPTGEFQRSIPLPVRVDADDVAAEARIGVLWIMIAKTEQCKPRQIQITTESETGEAGE
ncbi:MAG: hypothetical protein CMJ48_06030 [Planctomycetaceae bacterium]|nr:hypothetical protein [Planctomycetaceae bacterium]